MSNYLGPSCLTYLWNKIKTVFAVKEDKIPYTTITTTPFNVVAGNSYIVDCTNTDITVNLPVGSNAYLENIIFFVTTGASTTLTINPPSGGTLKRAEGFSETLDASEEYEINCLWNGSNWILAGTKIKTISAS